MSMKQEKHKWVKQKRYTMNYGDILGNGDDTHTVNTYYECEKCGAVKECPE